MIGLCVNLLVASLYYAFLGLYLAIKRIFCRPQTVSRLLLAPMMQPISINSPQINNNVSSHEDNNVLETEAVIKEGSSENNGTSIIGNVQVELSAINETTQFKQGLMLSSLRSTLRKGMTRHEKTGRISKMFVDNINVTQHENNVTNYLTI